MQDYLWYGTKDNFVVTKGHDSRESLDAYMTETTNDCGVEFDFITVGPSMLKINPELCPLEWIQDCKGIWFDAEALKDVLWKVGFDLETEKKMNKYKPNRLYFDLLATKQLLLQQIEELL